MEYLVTYGWAILAIVIIGAVLWYFGIFSPQTFVGSKRCVGFASFNCQDFRVDTTGTLSVVLNNKAGGRLLSVGMFMGNGTWAPCAGSYVDPTLNVTCTLTGFAQGSGIVGPYVSGSQFDPVAVKLNFTDARSGISHTDIGNVQGKIE